MQDFHWLSRTALITGSERIVEISQKHVLVVGMGGVGSFCAEFLCRGGIGEMTIVDGDKVDPTNRNRQLPAMATTHGQPKAVLMAERLKAINPELKLHVINDFVTPEKVEEILQAATYDYIADCIDSFTPKVTFLSAAHRKCIPIVSSMGAGGKIDPTRLKVVDISKTYNCPLAHQTRKRLRKEGIYKGIKAVFSTEVPMRDSLMLTDGTNFKKSAFGTMSYLPATFGATCASVVIRDLMNLKNDE